MTLDGRNRTNSDMATKLKPVDAVVVGTGVVGSIMAKELADAGLKVVALERGRMIDPQHDFAVAVHLRRAEIRPPQRHLPGPLARDDSRSATTRAKRRCRCARWARSSPGRRWAARRSTGAPTRAASCRGTSRPAAAPSSATARSMIPENCTSQDWGVTYEELEPYYDQFEHLYGVGGKAGNLNGVIQEGGNPFEGRARANIRIRLPR